MRGQKVNTSGGDNLYSKRVEPSKSEGKFRVTTWSKVEKCGLKKKEKKKNRRRGNIVICGAPKRGVFAKGEILKGAPMPCRCWTSRRGNLQIPIQKKGTVRNRVKSSWGHQMARGANNTQSGQVSKGNARKCGHVFAMYYSYSSI